VKICLTCIPPSSDHSILFFLGNLTIRVSMKVLSRRRQKEETVALQKDDLVNVRQVGNVMVNVIDDGAGMTNDQVKKVFDDFTQFNVNQLQAGGGSGLGLSIARGIVVQHGGTLSCSSDGLGKGTTFTVTLPIYEEISSVDQTERVSSQTSDHNTCIDAKDAEKGTFHNSPCDDEECDLDIPKLRVLVVDDSTMNRKLCMRLLERCGHSTEGASDGREAVKMVRQSLDSGHLYDCILLDYEMPIMCGPEACQLIRKMGCSSFIVGVTGNLMTEDVDHFQKCGANWVLPKPFRLEALEQQWIEHGVIPHLKSTSGEDPTLRVEIVDVAALDMTLSS
jgi:CheY-like chemotaxis protein